MAEFKGPTVMYGTGGASGVFRSRGDVPEGWQDDPTKVSAKPPVVPLTRDEIIAALVEGCIEHSRNTKTLVLLELLTKHVKEYLTENEIAFDPAADTKTLLELLPHPE